MGDISFDHEYIRIPISNNTKIDGNEILQELWTISSTGYREVKLYFNPELSFDDAFKDSVISNLLQNINKTSNNGKMFVNLAFYKNIKSEVQLIVDALVEDPIDKEVEILRTIMVTLNRAFIKDNEELTPTGEVINHLLEKLYLLCEVYMIRNQIYDSKFILIIDYCKAAYNVNPLYNLDTANDLYSRVFCKDMDMLINSNNLIVIDKPKHIEMDKVWLSSELYSENGVLDTLVHKLTERDINKTQSILDTINVSLFINNTKDPNDLKCNTDNHSIIYIKRIFTPYTLNELYIIGVPCDIWGTILQPRSFINILEFNTHFTYFVNTLSNALYYNKNTEFYLNMSKEDFLNSMRFKIELYYKPFNLT